MDTQEPTVTITQREYLSLKKDSDMFECLQCTGVDNWCGWDDAMEMHNSDEESV